MATAVLRESEREFESWVTGLMDVCGWLWYHPFDSRKSVEGFPDLTAVRGGELLVAELKTESGKLSPRQLAWFQEFRIVEMRTEVLDDEGVAFRPVRAFVWRPRDRPQIAQALR